MRGYTAASIGWARRLVAWGRLPDVSRAVVEDLEAIRQRFLPAGGIRVLMVGESPPPVRGFFYTGDSTLYRHTQPALVERCRFPSERDPFLARFAREGFYLADISTARGDKPHLRATAPDVQDAAAGLSRLIGARTVAVVGVLREIEPLVRAIVEQSDQPGCPWRCLTFPNSRNLGLQDRYRLELRRALQEFGCTG